MNIRTLLFGLRGRTTTSRSVDAGLLVLRVGMFALLALAHGLGKIPPSEGFITGTGEMGFPLPTLFAWAAALSEFVGSLLLALGLLTRPAALFVGVTMLVAFAIAHGAALTGENSGEQAFVYLVGALALGLAGPGRYSVDAAIAGRTPAY